MSTVRASSMFPLIANEYTSNVPSPPPRTRAVGEEVDVAARAELAGSPFCRSSGRRVKKLIGAPIGCALQSSCSSARSRAPPRARRRSLPPRAPRARPAGRIDAVGQAARGERIPLADLEKKCRPPGSGRSVGVEPGGAAAAPNRRVEVALADGDDRRADERAGTVEDALLQGELARPHDRVAEFEAVVDVEHRLHAAAGVLQQVVRHHELEEVVVAVAGAEHGEVCGSQVAGR